MDKGQAMCYIIFFEYFADGFLRLPRSSAPKMAKGMCLSIRLSVAYGSQAMSLSDLVKVLPQSLQIYLLSQSQDIHNQQMNMDISLV